MESVTKALVAGLLVGSFCAKCPAQLKTNDVADRITKVRNPGEPTLVRLPLAFEANQGQTDKRVHFLARGAAHTFFLASDQVILAMPPSSALPVKLRPDQIRPHKGDLEQGTKVRLTRCSQKLVGARKDLRPIGEELQKGRANYFIGNDPDKWRTGISLCGTVRYPKVYAGIDLVYTIEEGRVEYAFVVAPGANPAAIRMTFPEAESLKIDNSGHLVIKTPGATIRHTAPRIYQTMRGRRKTIEGSYTLLRDGKEVGFKVADHDPKATLVIDPEIVFSTYYGGTHREGITCCVSERPYNCRYFDLCVNANDQLFVTGMTSSMDFEVTDSSALGRLSDVFVMRIDFDHSSQPTLRYATYLGGPGGWWEGGNGIAHDANSSVYVAGVTDGTSFPIIGGAYQTENPGSNIAGFIARLDSQGVLERSTYLGGQEDLGPNEGGDWIRAVAVEPVGGPGSEAGVYVVGNTRGSDLATHDAYQSENGGQYDAFVAKLDPDLSTLHYYSFLGGQGHDYAYDVAVHGGNPYVTGITYSTDLPTTDDAAQSSHGIGGLFESVCAEHAAEDASMPSPKPCADAFIARFGLTNATNMHVTYLGRSNFDVGRGIVVDGDGNAYVAGSSVTSLAPHPRPGVLFAELKLDVYPSNLTKTHFGGMIRDEGADVVLDAHLDPWLAGWAESRDLATPGAHPSGGGVDAFLAKPEPTAGQGYSYFTYFGGEGLDCGEALALGPDGSFYLGGVTGSPDLMTRNPLQENLAGLLDIFIVKFAPPPEMDPLELEKIAEPADVYLHTEVDYWVSIDNPNNSAVYGIALTDALPSALRFDGLGVESTASGTDCNYYSETHSVNCTFHDGIPPGPTAVHIEATVSAIADNARPEGACNVAALEGDTERISTSDCHDSLFPPVEDTNLIVDIENTQPATTLLHGDPFAYQIRAMNRSLVRAPCVQLRILAPPSVGALGASLKLSGAQPAECQIGPCAPAADAVCLGHLAPYDEAGNTRSAVFSGKAPKAGTYPLLAEAQTLGASFTDQDALHVVGIKADLGVAIGPPELVTEVIEGLSINWVKFPVTVTLAYSAPPPDPIPWVTLNIDFGDDFVGARRHTYAPDDDISCFPGLSDLFNPESDAWQVTGGVGCNLFGLSGNRTLDVFVEERPPIVVTATASVHGLVADSNGSNDTDSKSYP